MAKNVKRKDGNNGAKQIATQIRQLSTKSSSSKSIQSTINSIGSNINKQVGNAANTIKSWLSGWI